MSVWSNVAAQEERHKDYVAEREAMLDVCQCSAYRVEAMHQTIKRRRRLHE